MSAADKHSEKVNFIWSVKEILRDHYRMAEASRRDGNQWAPQRARTP